MWLQRVVFNLRTRLLGMRESLMPMNRPSLSPSKRRMAKRIEALQNRLRDLDRRVAELQSLPTR